MRTAIQELIEMLKEARSVSMASKHSEASEDIIQTYTNAIRLSQSMLEKEQKQIIDAYGVGTLEGFKVFVYDDYEQENFSAEQYYYRNFDADWK